MILRINIGAFVLSDSVRNAVQALDEDRLFLRSSVSVQDGGLAGALEFLSQRSTPELLIVETAAQGEAFFAELNSLADVCQPGTRVIVVGAENDINLFKALIDQGISQYFLETVTPDELKAAIVDAFADKTLNAKSRTIAFTGLRGGVGSSVLAHNVASELANLYDEDVIIVDLDIPFGTAALSYNLQPSQTIADAIAQAGSIDETMLMRYLERGGKNISLLCAPGNLNSGIEITPPSPGNRAQHRQTDGQLYHFGHPAHVECVGSRHGGGCRRHGHRRHARPLQPARRQELGRIPLPQPWAGSAHASGAE